MKLVLTLVLFLVQNAFLDTKEQKPIQPYRPFRLVFFLTKTANIIEAGFHHPYSTHYGPLVTPWLKRHSIKYNQVCYSGSAAQRHAMSTHDSATRHRFVGVRSSLR